MKFISLIILFLNLTVIAQENVIIQFKFDSYQLTQKIKQQLEATNFNGITSNDSIVITGLADTTGNSVYNYWLALHRAEAIQNYIEVLHQDLKGKTIVASKGESSSNSHKKEFRIVKISIVKHENTDQSLAQQKVKINSDKNPELDNIIEGIISPDSSELAKDTNALVIENFVVGKKIRLGNIQFYPGTPLLLDENAKKQMNQLLQIMIDNPSVTIDIQGHVCCSNNYILSVQRALVVRKYLIENGVSQERITHSAYSNWQPLFPEVDIYTRQMNRRVEILVTGK